MSAAPRDSQRQASPPSHAWMRRGLCFGSPEPDLWFPEPGHADAAAEAKAVCRACPVSAECLAYAKALDIRHGVWGGTVPEERDGRKARRQSRPASPEARQRKTEAERQRRGRVSEAAAADRMKREQAQKGTAAALAAARPRARKARGAA